MSIGDGVTIDARAYPQYWRHKHRTLTIKKISLDLKKVLLEWYESLPGYEKRTRNMKSNYAIFWCPTEALKHQG